MLALTLALLAAAEGPSTPPLLPAEPAPRQVPWVPPELPAPVEPPALLSNPSEPERRDPDLEQTEALELAGKEEDSHQGFYMARVVAVGATAGLIGATLVGSSFVVATEVPGTGTWGVLVAVFSLPISLFLGSSVSYVVHRAMGGKGGWGAHLAGGAIGGGVGLIIAGLVALADGGHLSAGAIVGGMYGLSGTFGAGVALMGELSNYRTLRELRVSVSMTPVRGGAVAVAGVVF